MWCNGLQAADRRSEDGSESVNDGAESVEAKQDRAEGEQQEVEGAVHNQDAESVTARANASDDDSDLEEGEIAGSSQDISKYEASATYADILGMLLRPCMGSSLGQACSAVQLVCKYAENATMARR